MVKIRVLNKSGLAEEAVKREVLENCLRENMHRLIDDAERSIAGFSEKKQFFLGMARLAGRMKEPDAAMALWEKLEELETVGRGDGELLTRPEGKPIRDDGISSHSREARTGIIRDSWREVIANIKNGSYRTRYKVGDRFLLALPDEKDGFIEMQIAGFGIDICSGISSRQGSKSAVTLVSVDCLSRARAMGSYKGWQDSDLRRWLMRELWPALPEELREGIKPVVKKTYPENMRIPHIETTEDRLWLLSADELMPGGQCYPLFKDGKNRLKGKKGEPPMSWWLRSYTNFGFCAIGSNGEEQCYRSPALNRCGVVFGFCL